MNKVENLTDFEKDVLIRWFMHQMEWKQRQEMMENFPMMYHKITGAKPRMWVETIEKEKTK